MKNLGTPTGSKVYSNELKTSAVMMVTEQKCRVSELARASGRLKRIFVIF